MKLLHLYTEHIIYELSLLVFGCRNFKYQSKSGGSFDYFIQSVDRFFYKQWLGLETFYYNMK